MIVEKFLQKRFAELIALVGYPVFSSGAVPERQAFPFVLITEVQAIQRLGPCKSWTCFVTIDVATGSKGQIGRDQAMTIAEPIDTAIHGAAEYTADGYKIYSVYQSGSGFLDEPGTTDYIYRHLRTYTLQVSVVS
jgi:hypothetical protein